MKLWIKVFLAKARLWWLTYQLGVVIERSKRNIDRWNRLGELLKEQERNGG